MAYTLFGPDNDSHMCASADRVFDGMQGLAVCAKCGYKTDIFYINPKFKVKRRVYDLSYTYDGYCIVSLRFREACLRAKLAGAAFHALPADSEFFVLEPTCIASFDYVRRGTRFEELCTACGYYGAVAGATPAFLKEPLASDVCRTDILFGSGNGRHPIIIVSEAARTVFAKEKLKGLEYQSVA